MNDNQKAAIVSYLEFNLVAFLEKFESHIDPDVVGTFYEDAFAMLNDVDESIVTGPIS